VPAALPPGVTLEQASAYLGAPRAAGGDTLVRSLLGSVCAFAGRYTSRQLAPLTADHVDVRTQGRRWVRVPDARQVTAVVADGAPVADWEEIRAGGDTIVHIVVPRAVSGGALLYPFARLAPQGPQKVTVTGQFGFQAVPEDLADAIYTHTARNYRERDASYGDQVNLGDGGSIAFFRSMPPRVRAVYDSYRVFSDTFSLE